MNRILSVLVTCSLILAISSLHITNSNTHQQPSTTTTYNGTVVPPSNVVNTGFVDVMQPTTIYVPNNTVTVSTPVSGGVPTYAYGVPPVANSTDNRAVINNANTQPVNTRPVVTNTTQIRP